RGASALVGDSIGLWPLGEILLWHQELENVALCCWSLPLPIKVTTVADNVGPLGIQCLGFWMQCCHCLPGGPLVSLRPLLEASKDRVCSSHNCSGPIASVLQVVAGTLYGRCLGTHWVVLFPFQPETVQFLL
ncbi:hypothetical protein XENOCAPTIV_021153, partial [Xenoophorus captivus]